MAAIVPPVSIALERAHGEHAITVGVLVGVKLTLFALVLIADAVRLEAEPSAGLWVPAGAILTLGLLVDAEVIARAGDDGFGGAIGGALCGFLTAAALAALVYGRRNRRREGVLTLFRGDSSSRGALIEHGASKLGISRRAMNRALAACVRHALVRRVGGSEPHEDTDDTVYALTATGSTVASCLGARADGGARTE